MLTPRGPHCRCPTGFTHETEDSDVCRDLDECTEEEDMCTQRCTNHHGNYTCSCDPGYQLQPDLYSCLAKEGEAILLFNTRNSVKALYLKSKKIVTISSHAQQAVGVASDGVHVYWTEVDTGREAIMRAELADPSHTREVLVQTGLETPEDVAVDWATRAFYFTDSRRSHIAACASDARACAVLISRDSEKPTELILEKPRALVLHSAQGVMYWSDWGEKPHIGRANMDGSEPRLFVDKDITWPNGLALDLPNDKLYWVDAGIGGIESIHLDGTRRHKVLVDSVHHPYWLSVFESRLFWSDWGSNTLQFCEKFTGKFRRTITKGRIYGIQVYHPALAENLSTHACEHALCSDLCLLRGARDYSCACSEERQLGSDNHTCSPAARAPRVLVTGGSVAVTIAILGLGKFDPRPVHLEAVRIDAVAYNNVDELVYLYDGTKRSIDWISLESLLAGHSGAVTLINEDIHKIEDMAYDEVSGVLYWVDSGPGALHAYSTRTGARKLIYQFAEDERPISITTMPLYGAVLVAVRDSRGGVHVDSIGGDGSDRRHLFEHGFKGAMVRVRYHAEQDRLFISDSGTGIIETAHPEGTGREIFRTLSTTVWSAGGAGAELVWTDRRSNSLYWSNTHEDAGAPVRRLRLDVFTERAQLLVTALPPRPAHALGAHPCALPDAPCSHLCLQRHAGAAGARHTCACPAGLVLRAGGACEERVRCDADSVLCGRSNACVARARRCDGAPDCPLGEDEEGCGVPGAEGDSAGACGAARWLCGSGECVSAHRRCDAHPDCSDGSDEDDCHDHALEMCPAEQLDCGGGVCVDRRVACDGVRDCPDGSDELDCQVHSCSDHMFQCGDGNCVPETWLCDGEPDCRDASDEPQSCHDGDSESGDARCGAEEWACAGEGCVRAGQRCDARADCADGSDEWDCELAPAETACDEYEYMCVTNRSVCLPLEARCNGTAECPHGEDEVGCADAACSPNEMACKDGRCVSRNFVCDEIYDCKDGSDETLEACGAAHKNATQPIRPEGEACRDGFACRSGHCVELGEVCDGHRNCPDGSDEDGACETACAEHACEAECKATPRGARCTCPEGYVLGAEGRACVDRNECLASGERRACAHVCTNTDGGFVCTCHPGYVIRSNRRTCKAVGAPLQLVYARGTDVLAVAARGALRARTLLSVAHPVSDIAVHYRANKVYAVSEEGGALHQTALDPRLAGAPSGVSVANLGRPAKVAVDWITDAVYVAGGARDAGSLRACNTAWRACAVLPLPAPRPALSALATAPWRALLLYCAGEVLYARGADGAAERPLARALGACGALATDPHSDSVYVAHAAGDLDLVLLDGSHRRAVVRADARLAAPRALALWEDSLYLLGDLGDNTVRCRLFGGVECESVRGAGAGGAQALALAAAALQPAGEASACARGVCAPGAVCVGSLDHPGHACVCADGSLQQRADEQCAPIPAESMGVWTESPARGLSAGARATLGVLLALLVVVLAALLGLVYLRWRRRRDNAALPAVMFTRRWRAGRAGGRDEPAVDITPPDHTQGGSGGAYTEFVNPLRDAWRAVHARVTRTKHAHIKPDATHLDVPFADSDSDVESDRDAPAATRDKARLI